MIEPSYDNSLTPLESCRATHSRLTESHYQEVDYRVFRESTVQRLVNTQKYLSALLAGCHDKGFRGFRLPRAPTGAQAEQQPE